ncbi:MAG: hypothetical protein ACJ76F_14075 [Bacteroidia bacterium]
MKTGRFNEIKWYEWLVLPANILLAASYGITLVLGVLQFTETSSPFIPDYVPLMVLLPQTILLLVQLAVLSGITLRMLQKKTAWFFLHLGGLANFGIYATLMLGVIEVQLERGGMDLKSSLIFISVFFALLGVPALLYSPHYRAKFSPGKWTVIFSSILALLLIFINRFSHELISAFLY